MRRASPSMGRGLRASPRSAVAGFPRGCGGSRSSSLVLGERAAGAARSCGDRRGLSRRPVRDEVASQGRAVSRRARERGGSPAGAGVAGREGEGVPPGQAGRDPGARAPPPAGLRPSRRDSEGRE
jgi:hypothetical protein